MITTHFPLGDVRFSAEYFSTLVGEAAKPPNTFRLW